ncbi:MAG TPA: hypothetical protein VMH85_15290 [Terriglobales bacterium]|nr:hypothetical protein [Terriglobales bacterium]
MSATPVQASRSSEGETFTASRWTRGNFFFPTRIVVTPQRVSRVKPRLFGSNEESISISQVASVHIATGMIWSNIVIESSAGTDPVTSHGHRKADAKRIRDLIEAYQSGGSASKG